MGSATGFAPVPVPRPTAVRPLHRAGRPVAFEGTPTIPASLVHHSRAPVRAQRERVTRVDCGWGDCAWTARGERRHGMIEIVPWNLGTLRPSGGSAAIICCDRRRLRPAGVRAQTMPWPFVRCRRDRRSRPKSEIGSRSTLLCAGPRDQAGHGARGYRTRGRTAVREARLGKRRRTPLTNAAIHGHPTRSARGATPPIPRSRNPRGAEGHRRADGRARRAGFCGAALPALVLRWRGAFSGD